MESNSEPEKAIDEAAMYIEQWQYNGNRIKSSVLIQNKTSLKSKSLDIQLVINSLLVRRSAFAGNAFRYDNQFQILRNFAPDTVSLDVENDTSFFYANSVRIYAKNILESKFPFHIDVPTNKPLPPHDIEVENIIKVLIFCYYFYSNIIDRIKSIELEALFRIDSTLSTFMFYAGQICTYWDVKGNREKNRTADAKTAGDTIVADWHKKVRKIIKKHNLKNFLIEKSVSSCAERIWYWWGEDYPEDKESVGGRRPFRRSPKTIANFLYKNLKDNDLSQT